VSVVFRVIGPSDYSQRPASHSEDECFRTNNHLHLKLRLQLNLPAPGMLTEMWQGTYDHSNLSDP
jgi:hypothetical protein